MRNLNPNPEPTPPKRTEAIVVAPPAGFELSKCFTDERFKKVNLGAMALEFVSTNDKEMTVKFKMKGLILQKPKRWWCTVHNCEAKGRKRDGVTPQCEGGGVLMPCACVEMTNDRKPE